MVAIVNYGLGNLASLRNLFDRLKTDCSITSERKVLGEATHIVLPGVGHFGRGMKNLKELDLIGPLNELVLEKKTPLLGICLGMQLLTLGSEEGSCEGLGWIEAETKRFNLVKNSSRRLRVPHVGFNSVQTKSNYFPMTSSPLYFYFTHSFYVDCLNPSQTAGTTVHGIEFSSAVNRENIFGTQFHPEKSHNLGLDLIKSFIQRNQCLEPELSPHC